MRFERLRPVILRAGEAVGSVGGGSLVDSSKHDREITRREALKRGGLVAGVAWSTPVIMSLRTPAFAQASRPCFFTCSYVVWIEIPSLACVEPDRCDSCDGCGTCDDPGCPHITSVQRLPDGGVRFCTDCEPFQAPQGGYCWACTDFFRYVPGFWEKDPADGRCATAAPPDADCKPSRLEVAFLLCEDCRNPPPN